MNGFGDIFRITKVSLGMSRLSLNLRQVMGRILHPDLNEFTSRCTSFFNRLKISNLQNGLHIWLVSKGADVHHFCKNLIYKEVFPSRVPRSKFVKMHSARLLRSAFRACLEDVAGHSAKCSVLLTVYSRHAVVKGLLQI